MENTETKQESIYYFDKTALETDHLASLEVQDWYINLLCARNLN